MSVINHSNGDYSIDTEGPSGNVSITTDAGQGSISISASGGVGDLSFSSAGGSGKIDFLSQSTAADSFKATSWGAMELQASNGLKLNNLGMVAGDIHILHGSISGTDKIHVQSLASQILMEFQNGGAIGWDESIYLHTYAGMKLKADAGDLVIHQVGDAGGAYGIDLNCGGTRGITLTTTALGAGEDSSIELNSIGPVVIGGRSLIVDNTATATFGVISSFADAGGGQVTVTTTAAHNIPYGQHVSIANTTNYNGTYIAYYVNSTSFRIDHSWDGNDATGTYHEGAAFFDLAGPFSIETNTGFRVQCNTAGPDVISLKTVGSGEINITSGGGLNMNASGQITMGSLPTTDPSVAGALWNNGGVVNISAG